MTRLAFAIVLCITLAIAFVVGTFSGVMPLMIVGFCGWTPAVGFLGFTLAKVGLKITLDMGESNIRVPQQQPVRRRALLREDMQ